jgi:ABC-type glycerol-3-phosphate transport system substrate-binding protein
MKKKKALVTLLALVAAAVVYGAPASETAAKPLDKIVYMETSFHGEEARIAPFVAQFKKITGVTLEIQPVSSLGSDEIMIARFMAGDFPDIARPRVARLDAFVRQGFFVPLDGFIKSSPRMTRLKESNLQAFDAHTVDGKAYGVPTDMGQKGALWVRLDILKSLGLAMPTTLDEFIGYCRAVRDRYKGPEGIKTYPLVVRMDNTGYTQVIANYFDVTILPVIKHPGDARFREGWDTPQIKDYIDFIRLLYSEGYIDSEHALPQKSDVVRAKFASGKGSSFVYWYDRYSSVSKDVTKNFPKAEVGLLPPIVNPKGGVMGMSLTAGTTPVCITKGSKSPQFAWEQFIEKFFFDLDVRMLFAYGVPGVDYEIRDNAIAALKGQAIDPWEPYDPDQKLPFKLPASAQKISDVQGAYNAGLAKNGYYASMSEPSVSVAGFDQIRDDMMDKKNQLLWKCVLGQITFEQLTSQFEAYKKEVGFADILAQINAKSK